MLLTKNPIKTTMDVVTLNDISWVLICTALVFLMQAGFCCLEVGLTRKKYH
jgi:ammonia channel protein AmtB